MIDIIRIISELLSSTCFFFIFFYSMFLHYKFKGYSNKEIVKKIFSRHFFSLYLLYYFL